MSNRERPDWLTEPNVVEPLVAKQMEALQPHTIKEIIGSWRDKGSVSTVVLVGSTTEKYHMMEANQALKWLKLHKPELLTTFQKEHPVYTLTDYHVLEGWQPENDSSSAPEV